MIDKVLGWILEGDHLFDLVVACIGTGILFWFYN